MMNTTRRSTMLLLAAALTLSTSAISARAADLIADQVQLELAAYFTRAAARRPGS